MGRTYRWGILGAGRIAEKFCTAISFVEGSEVYAVASREIDKAKDYAARYGATSYYDNYEDLARDENVDIIYIATPHNFHYDQTMLCLRHKKAVVCEKPMTLSYRQNAELVAAAAEAKVFLMEGLWTACMPFIKRIKTVIEQGVIGQVQCVLADFGFDAIKDMESRLYNKSLAGGSVLDIGVYTISLATIILGEPVSIRSVSKLATTGVDEYANIVMQYENGATAHVLSSIVFNTPVEARIIGTKGMIKIESPWFKATRFSVHPNDGAVQDFDMPHLCNGFEYEVMDVMRSLDDGLLQSDEVPHALTLSVSKIMDEVLHQAGIVYE